MNLNERYTSYVQGENTPSDGRTAPLVNPALGEEVSEVHTAGPNTVDTAVDAARATFPEWRDTDSSERGAVLSQVADVLLDRKEALAELETRQNGKPLHESRFDVEASAGFFRYFAGTADKVEGAEIPVPGKRLSFTQQEPYGVTAHVIPWNSPLILAARSFAPALACGNAIVAAVDAKTPATVLALAEILESAGVPTGAVNLLVGDVETGRALTTSTDIDSVTFTGSVETGKEVLHACAETITPSIVELGSKSPNVVMADADIGRAAESAVTSGYLNAGQQCFAGSRVLVHKDIAGQFLDEFLTRTEALTVGAGTADETDMGPLISAAHRDEVQEYIETGRQEGATLRLGGDEPAVSSHDGGYFLEPTVFTDVTSDMRIAREEIFGPVVSVLEFDDYNEMVTIANDTDYGLTAGVWTESVRTAHRAIRDLEFGVVSVNEYPATWAQTPFGGYKQSGIGREKGQQAIEHYTQVKNGTIAFE